MLMIRHQNKSISLLPAVLQFNWETSKEFLAHWWFVHLDQLISKIVYSHIFGLFISYHVLCHSYHTPHSSLTILLTVTLYVLRDYSIKCFWKILIFWCSIINMKVCYILNKFLLVSLHSVLGVGDCGHPRSILSYELTLSNVFLFCSV